MSQETNLFNPDTFTVSSALNGTQGVVQEALVVRHNYGGTVDKDSTALRLTVVAEHLEKPRVAIYGLGDKVRPSEDRRTPSMAGPFIVGGTINKTSNGSLFFNALRASGFPMEKLGELGVEALNGAIFEWEAVDKSFTAKDKKRVEKVYDVPVKFIGFEGAADPEVEAAQSSLRDEVSAALQQALESEPEISRAQLSTKVGPLLKDSSNRIQALALLLQDSFLASVEGVVFDKKSVRKS